MDASKKDSFGSKIGKGADVIVGDLLFGGIGRAAFHAGKIPGVQKAATYVGENVSAGYRAAETGEKKRKAVAALREIVKKGVALSPEALRAIAKDNGLDSKALDEIVAQARKVAGKDLEIPMPGNGTYGAPAAAS